MTITYKTFTDGQTNLRFAKSLVLGFMVQNGIMETRYALYVDGRIYQSETREISCNFANKSEKWTKVNKIPDDAEFIGNYPLPVK